MTNWKPIARFNGLYWISSDGRVGKKAGPGDPRPLIGSADKRGYRRAEVRWGGKKVVISVHREMAIAFIPNPDGLPFVRHLNDVKYDNRLENLAWGKPKQNTEDSV